MKKLIFLLIFILLFPAVTFAETGLLADDCADFSKIYKKSENLVCSVASEAEQASFDADFTYFQRTTLSPEWIVYKTAEDLTVSTYFWEGEAFSHFNFYTSSDGEVFRPAKPKIKIHDKIPGKWYVVDYILKQKGTEYVKIEFANLNGNSWNPAIRSVKSGAATVKQDLYDVLGTRYEKDVQLLNALGILNGFEDKTFRPEEKITRASFAAAAVKLMNMEEAAQGGYTYFTDVDAEAWYTPYVNFLTEHHVISQDEFFHPDSEVSYTEAIKMVVEISGYGELARIKGGYPNGYLSVAADLKLPVVKEMSRGAMAQIFAAALDIKIFEPATIGETYEYRKTDALLYKYFKITSEKGVVSDNGITSLTGNSMILKNEAAVGGIIYKNACDLQEYLGYTLKIYVKDEQIIYFENETEEVVTFSEDFEFDGVKIRDDTKKVSVNKEMRIIYNGEFLGKAADVDLKKYLNEAEKITVIGDETIHVKDYSTFILSADSSLKTEIFDKYSGAFSVNAENCEYVRLIRDGEETEDLSVFANEVIQLAKSINGKCLYALVTNDCLIGQVETIGDETLTIYGNEYKISDYFIKNAVLRPGDYGDFYFDAQGRIARCEIKNSESYGYIIKVDEPEALSGDILIKALTENGEPEIINVSAKASGKTLLIPDTLVKFRKNADGEIKEILTANLDFEGVSTCYAGTFATLYNLGADTKLFIIPEDETYDFGYKVRNKNAVIHTRVYNIRVYDSDEKYEPKIVLIFENGSELSTLTYSSPVFVVTSVATALNEAGEPAIQITGYEKKEKKSYIISTEAGRMNIGFDGYTNKAITPDMTGEKIKSGDVVQFALNEKNEITDIRFLYKDGAGMFEWTYGNAVETSEVKMYGDMAAFCGEVKNRFPGKLIASAENGWKRSFNIGSADIYIKNNAGIIPAKESDIHEGDRAFIAIQASGVTTVMVIKQ